MAQSNYDPAVNMPSPGYSSKPAPPVERQPIVRSRANITSACLACKRRKRKCLGGSPCPHCASLRIQCSYDERLDKRRKAFNEKARAEIDLQRRLLDGLIKAIKSEHAPIILDMVRSNASLEEIATKLELLDMLTDLPCESSQYVRTSHDQEISTSQSRQSRLTTSISESENLHPLSIEQLLAPRHQQQQQHHHHHQQQQQQQQQQQSPPLNSSISIPSLSEVLLEAQKHRLHDEGAIQSKSSASFPQEQVSGPRLTTFPPRIDVRPPGAGQPSLTSHPPQDYMSGITHAHSPVHGPDPRLPASPTR